MLDFRSLLIGEIAGGFAEKAQGVSNSQFYVLICEACKILKVSPPTLQEWNEFMDFLAWYEKIQINAQTKSQENVNQ